MLKIVYQVIGPASRQLQAISIDLASAAALLDDCKKRFEEMRLHADSVWDKLYKESVEFAVQHGVSEEFPEERRRKKKRHTSEEASDECLVGKDRFKVDTFLVVLDEVSQQFGSRFSDFNVAFMKQLALFTPACLLSSSNNNGSSEDIRAICEQYGLDHEDVYTELTDFKETYRVCGCGTTSIPEGMQKAVISDGNAI